MIEVPMWLYEVMKENEDLDKNHILVEAEKIYFIDELLKNKGE